MEVGGEECGAPDSCITIDADGQPRVRSRCYVQVSGHPFSSASAQDPESRVRPRHRALTLSN